MRCFNYALICCKITRAVKACCRSEILCRKSSRAIRQLDRCHASWVPKATRSHLPHLRSCCCLAVGGRELAGPRETQENPAEPRAPCSGQELCICSAVVLPPPRERWHGLWSDTLSPHNRAIRHCFAWPHESRSSKGGCTLLEPGNLAPNKPPVLQEPALLPPQVTVSHIARAHFSMISTCEVGAAP